MRKKSKANPDTDFKEKIIDGAELVDLIDMPKERFKHLTGPVIEKIRKNRKVKKILNQLVKSTNIDDGTTFTGFIEKARELHLMDELNALLGKYIKKPEVVKYFGENVISLLWGEPNEGSRDKSDGDKEGKGGDECTPPGIDVDSDPPPSGGGVKATEKDPGKQDAVVAASKQAP